MPRTSSSWRSSRATAGVRQNGEPRNARRHASRRLRLSVSSSASQSAGRSARACQALGHARMTGPASPVHVASRASSSGGSSRGSTTRLPTTASGDSAYARTPRRSRFRSRSRTIESARSRAVASVPPSAAAAAAIASEAQRSKAISAAARSLGWARRMARPMPAYGVVRRPSTTSDNEVRSRQLWSRMVSRLSSGRQRSFHCSNRCLRTCARHTSLRFSTSCSLTSARNNVSPVG